MPFTRAVVTFLGIESVDHDREPAYCAVHLMQAVLFKPPGHPWWWLGGMTLLERNLRLLEAVGVKTVLVLYPPEDTLPPLTVPRALQLDMHADVVEIAPADPLAILPSLQLADHQPVFFLEANLLLDQRVLETLGRQTPPCFVAMGNGGDPSPLWRVGWLRPEDLPLGTAVLQRASRMALTAVVPYDPELRGEAPPYCEKIRNDKDLARGWQLLIDRVPQRSGDIIDKTIDPPIENWLVRQWSPTPITPDQVTILSLAVALVGVSLFYQGWFFLAVFFAWVAIVLDGAKRRLARIKLMPLRLGMFERVIGVFYENAWYLALAARLARTHHPAAWGVGLTITACDICDRILGRVFVLLKGKPLDEMSSFDQYFQLIGGRRHISLLILLAGFFLHVPFLALQTVLYWVGTTVLIHVARAVYHLLRPTPSALKRSS